MQEETLEDDENVYGLDGGDDFMDVYSFPNSLSYNIKYVQLFVSVMHQ